jgi:hypothetical protein
VSLHDRVAELEKRRGAAQQAKIKAQGLPLAADAAGAGSGVLAVTAEQLMRISALQRSEPSESF